MRNRSQIGAGDYGAAVSPRQSSRTGTSRRGRAAALRTPDVATTGKDYARSSERGADRRHRPQADTVTVDGVLSLRRR